MTQDERWQAKYDELMTFMRTNDRRPSKFVPEERNMRNWLRHNIKYFAHGEMPVERLERFQELMQLAEECRRKNQYE